MLQFYAHACPRSTESTDELRQGPKIGVPAFAKASAGQAGIIRENGEAVYYLDSDDVKFIRQDPAKVTMFKKAFLSPERQ